MSQAPSNRRNDIKSRKRRAAVEATMMRESSTDSPESGCPKSVDTNGFDIFDESRVARTLQSSPLGVILVDHSPEGPLVVALGTALPASRHVVCVGSEPCQKNPFGPNDSILSNASHAGILRRLRRHRTLERRDSLRPSEPLTVGTIREDAAGKAEAQNVVVVPFVPTTKLTTSDELTNLGLCRTDECVHKDGRQVSHRHERVVFECSAGCRFLQHAICFRKIQKSMQSLIARKCCVTPGCDGLLFRATLLDDCGMVSRKFVDDKSAMECLRKLRRDIELSKAAALVEAQTIRDEALAAAKERQRARRVERLLRRKRKLTTPPRKRELEVPTKINIQPAAPKRYPIAPPSRPIPPTPVTVPSVASPTASTQKIVTTSYAVVAARSPPAPSRLPPFSSDPSSSPSDSRSPECDPRTPAPLLPLASGSGLSPVPIGVAPPPTLPPRPPPPEAILLLQGLLPPSWMVSSAVPIRLRKFVSTIKSVLLSDIDKSSDLRIIEAARQLSKQAESLLTQVERYERSVSSTATSIRSTRVHPATRCPNISRVEDDPATSVPIANCHVPAPKTGGGLVHINRRYRSWRLPPNLLNQTLLEKNLINLFDDGFQVLDEADESGRPSLVLSRLPQFKRKKEF